MDSTSSACPPTPWWNIDRPFLTGQFHQEISSSQVAELQGFSMEAIGNTGMEKAVGCYHASVQLSPHLFLKRYMHELQEGRRCQLEKKKNQPNMVWLAENRRNQSSKLVGRKCNCMGKLWQEKPSSCKLVREEIMQWTGCLKCISEVNHLHGEVDLSTEEGDWPGVEDEISSVGI